MNNISIANETIKITADGFFELNGKRIELPVNGCEEVEVITPAEGAELVKNTIISSERMCEITVTTESHPRRSARAEPARPQPLVISR